MKYNIHLETHLILIIHFTLLFQGAKYRKHFCFTLKSEEISIVNIILKFLIQSENKSLLLNNRIK